MREIQFRAFENGIMYQQVRCGGLFNGVPTAPTTWIEEKGWVNLTGQPHTKVMQFTGLKDKNGVEIYEGDVCRTRYYSAMWRENLETVQVVMWDEDESSFGLRKKNMANIEVIGNIYENPELLKGESE